MFVAESLFKFHLRITIYNIHTAWCYLIRSQLISHQTSISFHNNLLINALGRKFPQINPIFHFLLHTVCSTVIYFVACCIGMHVFQVLIPRCPLFARSTLVRRGEFWAAAALHSKHFFSCVSYELIHPVAATIRRTMCTPLKHTVVSQMWHRWQKGQKTRTLDELLHSGR